MTAKLSATGLTLFRGDRCLFEDVGFALDAGQLLLLEGPNGSGKTSLLKAIVGMLELEAGAVYWDGDPVLEQRQLFHGSLAWMAHRVGFKADLTLVENLRFEAVLRPQVAVDIDDILERVDVARLKRLPMRSLSAGQQRRVALARMLLADVPLWLMDEPYTNLDREGSTLVAGVVNEHLAGGGLCVMAAHQDVDIDAPVQKVTLR
ncbi:MAG: cytochrome c biogenesis heme-transporting ATPase CcmA [Proteobacteria bacterium]|nr:cytochrome c biogenesis heme-transporting ATPase CcmA [Pseudomonadota bacterium]